MPGQAAGATACSPGSQVSLDGKTAEFLGLVLHELAANAVERGALSAPHGKVNAVWTFDDPKPGKGLGLIRIETDAPVVETDTAKAGFGKRQIEQGLPYQLGGEAEFDLKLEDSKCRMRISLSVGAGP